jgi:hypothetical protein
LASKAYENWFQGEDTVVSFTFGVIVPTVGFTFGVIVPTVGTHQRAMQKQLTLNSSASLQVQITLFAKKLKEKDVVVEVDEQSATAKLTFPDGSVFERRWSLYGRVRSVRLSPVLQAACQSICLFSSLSIPSSFYLFLCRC